MKAHQPKSLKNAILLFGEQITYHEFKKKKRMYDCVSKQHSIFFHHSY